VQVSSAPPWHEDTAPAQVFRQRLTIDTGRDGFRVVVARTATPVDGFATGDVPVIVGRGRQRE
jgi:hypothetical protein